MQSYTPLGDTATTTVKEAVLNHENNINAIRSTNSGTAFPTDNLEEGMHCYRTDLSKDYIYTGGEWKEFLGDYAKSDDIANEVSTKSLTVTGETSVPTPDTANNSTTIANTSFVHGVVNELVNGAPTALDALQELATALGNDPNFSTTVLDKIGEKESKTDANVEYAAIRSEAASTYATKAEVDTKQDKGNYVVSTALSKVATSGSYSDLTNTPTVDGALSSTSANAIQNKAVSAALAQRVSVGFTNKLQIRDYDSNFPEFALYGYCNAYDKDCYTTSADISRFAYDYFLEQFPMNSLYTAKANVASPTFTGTVTAPTLTVTTTLNIPGGKIWIS